MAIGSSSAFQPPPVGEAGSRYSVAAEGGDEWEDADRKSGGTGAHSQQPTDKVRLHRRCGAAFDEAA